MRKSTVTALAFFSLLLAACADDGSDTYYSDKSVASKNCYDRGLRAGTSEYDTCVHEEIDAQRIDELHKEHDKMLQEREDYRNRRYDGL